MTPTSLAELGAQLYEALKTRLPVSPLTTRHPQMTIEEAYGVSQHFLQNRFKHGEVLIGKKIGVTSRPVQDMLGVHQPDFGYLTSAMYVPPGEPMFISDSLIQPRAEGELAFRLHSDLVGPGVTHEDVLRATAAVIPCFEIVDSRIQDWRIRIQDTVADNASCGLFTLGGEERPPHGIDLAACQMTVWKNGTVLSRGTGAEAMGSPLACVAWLANTLAQYGVSLCAGDIILSGSWVPLEPVQPGDEMSLYITDIGGAHVRFR